MLLTIIHIWAVLNWGCLKTSVSGTGGSHRSRDCPGGGEQPWLWNNVRSAWKATVTTSILRVSGPEDRPSSRMSPGFLIIWRTLHGWLQVVPPDFCQLGHHHLVSCCSCHVPAHPCHWPCHFPCSNSTSPTWSPQSSSIKSQPHHEPCVMPMLLSLPYRTNKNARADGRMQGDWGSPHRNDAQSITIKIQWRGKQHGWCPSDVMWCHRVVLGQEACGISLFLSSVLLWT
jgi:hypothetical protein